MFKGVLIKLRKHSLFALCLVLLISVKQKSAFSQEVDEVSLTFAYPAIGHVYVNAVFKNDQPMLGIGEVLSLLMIQNQRTANSFGFKGTYPTKQDAWEIDPVKLVYKLNNQTLPLNANQFHLAETDLYLSIDIYKNIFNIDFLINQYSLSLSMKSEYTLPIEELRKRQDLRQQLKNASPENILKTYPLLYPRQRSFLAPGMLDYNLGISNNFSGTRYVYSLIGGIELLGGDLQGGLSGQKSTETSTLNVGGIRWRYVFKGGLDPINNSLLSEINIGQLTLGGPSPQRIRGISLGNTPIVPRKVLDVFVIDGVTTPDSEVELLIGGQLVDFTRADEVGYYRFSTPLTFGTIRIGLRIYTPQGEVLYEDKQIQIPFNFVPRGLTTYNAQIGYRENLEGQVDNELQGNADVSYGLTNNITVRVGANRLASQNINTVTPYGGLSLRLFDQYLFNVDAQPDRFYRVNGSVMFSNNTNITLAYIENVGLNLITSNAQIRNLQINYFLPVTVFNLPSGMRIGFDRSEFINGDALNYQVDVNTRIGKIITRLNYREEVVNRRDLEIGSRTNRLATATLTYSIPRKPGIPVFVRGMFFRTSFKHDMKSFDASALGSFQFSQTFLKRGRFTFSYDRDILRASNIFQVGVLFDFNQVRTSTQVLSTYSPTESTFSFNQNVSGSVGMDLKNGAFLYTNRDQVGRAGVTVRMFIDDNNNGSFDKGEQIVPSKAIKIDQSANMYIGSDGMLRITQLQSYWTYKLTVDPMALPDVSLSPTKDKFSFVADPNRYKQIDIPLYRTGTIEGRVLRQRSSGGNFEPQSGLRLYLKRDGDDSENQREPLRTFSDGGFYAFGLIPGDYTLLVDSGQMAYMRAQQEPDTLKFTIRALSEGDYIDNLEIRLVPAKKDSAKDEDGMTLAELEYMLGEQLKAAVGSFVSAQETFYQGKYKESLRRVDSSLAIFESDFGLALKGSIVFVLGNKDDGRRYWQLAREKNPFIVIPDSTSIRPRKDSVFTPNEQWVELPLPVVLDSAEQVKADFLARLESQLSDKLQQSVSLFVEAQEHFYRRQFVEAELTVDSSLNLMVTDHGLALKGSIAYITGKKGEARRLWEEARYRNPLITLPDTEILDRMIKPITETSQRNARRQPATN